jgi:hypothetical protein
MVAFLQHNGSVAGFAKLRRLIQQSLREEIFDLLQGLRV